MLLYGRMGESTRKEAEEASVHSQNSAPNPRTLSRSYVLLQIRFRALRRSVPRRNSPDTAAGFSLEGRINSGRLLCVSKHRYGRNRCGRRSSTHFAVQRSVELRDGRERHMVGLKRCEACPAVLRCPGAGTVETIRCSNCKECWDGYLVGVSSIDKIRFYCPCQDTIDSGSDVRRHGKYKYEAMNQLPMPAPDDSSHSCPGCRPSANTIKRVGSI